MKTNSQIDKLLVEESSEWIETLKHGNPKDLEAFGQWMRESKRHVRHFLMMAALDKELQHFDPERKFSIPDVKDHGAQVLPFNEHAQTAQAPAVEPDKPVVADEKPAPAAAEPGTLRRLRAFRWWSFAAVFLVCLGLSSALYWLPSDNRGWQEYSTVLGEQRAVELQDGSVVQLNTASRIAVRLSENTRDIRLLDGEALFKVHHDPSKPFRVHTLGAVIQAIGTQFNVYRRQDGATVSVVEGRVQMSSETVPLPSAALPPSPNSGEGQGEESPRVVRLSAGEEAKIDRKGRIESQPEADVARSTAWRQRRLIFKQDSLDAIVTEFNRYNRVPQFKVVGAGVAGRRYSGAFDADDPESLSQLLASDPDLLVQRSGDEILVRARHEPRAFANSP